MAVSLVLLVGLAISVVALTRLVVRGIELYAAAGGMSSKAKGQFLGYATSLPEMVGTIGTAGNGLLAAGLWNIAASNIINWVLFVSAAIYYGRLRALAKRKFVDEMLFAFAAFCIPLVLSSMQDSAARSPWTAGVLFSLFLGYLYLDKRLNPNPPPSVQATSSRNDKGEGKARALGLVAVGVLGIILAGNYLGEEAKLVVEGMGVPQWAVGWILGFITSLPEMTAFFAVFGSAVGEMADGDDTDCQENLDSLAASTMSNLGLLYPIGIAVFLVFGS